MGMLSSTLFTSQAVLGVSLDPSLMIHNHFSSHAALVTVTVLSTGL